MNEFVVKALLAAIEADPKRAMDIAAHAIALLDKLSADQLFELAKLYAPKAGT